MADATRINNTKKFNSLKSETARTSEVEWSILLKKITHVHVPLTQVNFIKNTVWEKQIIISSVEKRSINLIYTYVIYKLLNSPFASQQRAYE